MRQSVQAKEGFFPSFLLLNSLAAFFVFLALVQPYHFFPWTAAINNFLAIVGGMLALLAIVLGGYGFVSFGFTSILLSLLLLFHLHLADYAGNYAIIVYVVVVGLAVSLFYVKASNPGSINHLLGAIYFAALMAVLAGLHWLSGYKYATGILDFMVVYPEDARWGGNLNQPNNTGTLLVWGVIVSIYFRKLICGSGLNALVAKVIRFMLAGSALLMSFVAIFVQSRTAALNFILMFGFALVYRKKAGFDSLVLIFLCLIVYFSAPHILVFFNFFDSFVEDSIGGRGFGSNLRLEIWSDFSRLILDAPLWGYGLGGVTRAFLDIENYSAAYGMVFAHAHNIGLDLILYFGVLGGGFLILCLLVSIFRILIGLSERSIWPALMLVTLLVHAMLELPLHYPYFLIPMAIIWGWLSGQEPEKFQAKPVFSVPVRWFSGGALVVLVPLFYVLSVAYLHHEQGLRQAKLEMAIKGWTAPAAPPPYPVLWELEALNEFVRANNEERYTPEQLQRFDDVLSVYPAKALIAKGLAVFAYNGLEDRVAYWQKKGCQIYAGELCKNDQ